jgi:carbamoyltransferase
VELFGAPRDPGAPFFTAASGYPSYFGPRAADHAAQAERNQYYADLAASIQAVVEEVVLRMARYAHRRTGLPRLCMAGGVALNSVANGRVLREAPFEELYVQPAAGDSGGALGAALWGHHAVLGRPRGFVMEHAAWGQEYGRPEVQASLEANGAAYTPFDDEDRLLDHVVDRLEQGRVVGWFQGRFEWGPRALGQRSILADPRRPEMKDLVNVKIKYREPFRPFAPSVPIERAGEFFALEDAPRHFPARYMLYVVDVKPAKRELLPAVTHVDGSARLQTVDAATAPRYHRLIQRFGEATGVPVILNTSFNLKGEPIVNTPAEAYSTFERSGMDMLVLGNHIVEKSPARPR